MSILLVSVSTALPSTLPVTLHSMVTTAPAIAHKSSIGLETELLIWFVWAAIGATVAAMLGVFRRGSVNGPARLSADASGGDLLAVLCFAFFVEIAVIKFAFRHLHFEGEMSTLVAEASGKGASALAILLACAFCNVLGIGKLGLGIRRAGIGIAAGTAALFILFPFIELTGSAVLGIEHFFHLHRADMHPVLQTLRDSHSRWTKTTGIFLAVLIAPVAEELFFRGMLQTALGRMCDWFTFELTRTSGVGGGVFNPGERHNIGTRWAAILMTSAIFAAVHGQVEFLAPLFVLSVGLGYAYERTGNLWVTITSHALFNAAQIVLLMIAG